MVRTSGVEALVDHEPDDQEAERERPGDVDDHRPEREARRWRATAPTRAPRTRASAPSAPASATHTTISRRVPGRTRARADAGTLVARPPRRPPPRASPAAKAHRRRYSAAIPASPSRARSTLSTIQVENVVSPPQKPTADERTEPRRGGPGSPRARSATTPSTNEPTTLTRKRRPREARPGPPARPAPARSGPRCRARRPPPPRRGSRARFTDGH